MTKTHRGLCLLRNELRRRCRIYPGGTVAGDAYRRDLAVTYMSRISHLLASVVLDDASAALDGMDAVLGEVRRSEFLGLADDGTDAADELAREVEAARDEVQYLIDDGMGDEGCEALVLSAMEDRILPQAEEALTRFREEVAP